MTLTKSHKSHSRACEIVLDKLVQLDKNTEGLNGYIYTIRLQVYFKTEKKTHMFRLDVANHVVRAVQGITESILVGS